MRKYLGILTILVLSFAMTLWAQSSGSDQTGGTSGSSSSGQTSSGSSSTSSDQSQSGSQAGQGGSVSGQSGQYGQTGTMSGQSGTTEQGANKGKEKTVDGCIVRHGGDYFLVDKRGNTFRLKATGGEDLSAHVGHHVKVRGSEAASAESMGPSGTASESPSASSSGGQYPSTSGQTGTSTQPPDTSGQAGATGGVAGSTSSSQPQAGSSQSQTGAVGGSTGATSRTGGMSTATAREMSVSKIQHVSDTCPANIQDKIDAMGGSSGPTDQSNPNPR